MSLILAGGEGEAVLFILLLSRFAFGVCLWERNPMDILSRYVDDLAVGTVFFE